MLAQVYSDLIGQIRVWVNDKIREEETRSEPDAALVAYLQRESRRWFEVGRDRRLLDDEQVEQAITEYGALVRTLNGT